MSIENSLPTKRRIILLMEVVFSKETATLSTEEMLWMPHLVQGLDTFLAWTETRTEGESPFATPLIHLISCFNGSHSELVWRPHTKQRTLMISLWRGMDQTTGSTCLSSFTGGKSSKLHERMNCIICITTSGKIKSHYQYVGLGLVTPTHHSRYHHRHLPNAIVSQKMYPISTTQMKIIHPSQTYINNRNVIVPPPPLFPSRDLHQQLDHHSSHSPTPLHSIRRLTSTITRYSSPSPFAPPPL